VDAEKITGHPQNSNASGIKSGCGSEQNIAAEANQSALDATADSNQNALSGVCSSAQQLSLSLSLAQANTLPGAGSSAQPSLAFTGKNVS
jgi:hypothetical protein